MASSSSQNTSALDVVQLVDTVTRWTGIWCRAEINQIDVCCNDKFSHGFEKLGLLRGCVLDLAEGYHWNKQMHREKAWQIFDTGEPRQLVGAPRSTLFCELDRLFGKPRDPAERDKLLNKCEHHVRLCVMMYKYQHATRQVFVQEHPYTISKWEMQEIWKLMSEASVYTVELNQCYRGKEMTGSRSLFEVILTNF